MAMRSCLVSSDDGTDSKLGKASLPAINSQLMNRAISEELASQIKNRFLVRLADQSMATIPSFTLESGIEMLGVPVAYMSWGKLSPKANNVMVICHALSGSADVSDWWGPLLGPGRAFDTDKFFVICMNSLGSPYGTASPVTAKDGDWTQGWYGADFPLTTIRDDVRLHRLLLDKLGVQQVAAVVGGSMGGMLALEWAFYGKDYVRCIVPVATSSHQSAWGIAWGEAQRHAISSDSKYRNGRYSFDDSPALGLEAARMTALLTYRSRESLERRFGRETTNRKQKSPKDCSLESPKPDYNSDARNGFGGNDDQIKASPTNGTTTPGQATAELGPLAPGHVESSFAAQTYLRYQAKKFSDRFDSNCYLALTQKLDTHDLARGRADTIQGALSLIQQAMLVVGVQSDGLYTLSEQEQIARSAPNAEMREIISDDGHDAFLIEQQQLNGYLMRFFWDNLPDMMRN